MKALSINPEYVGQIAVGEKTDEYRTWQTSHRGDIVICCTATKKTNGFAALVVDLYDIIRDGDVYAWQLRDVRPIKPFVVVGRQRLFDIDHEIEIIPDDEKLIDRLYNDFQSELIK